MPLSPSRSPRRAPSSKCDWSKEPRALGPRVASGVLDIRYEDLAALRIMGAIFVPINDVNAWRLLVSKEPVS